MYAIEATVRSLIVNRRSAITASEIQATAVAIDAEIDGILSESCWWPENPSGTDISASPPALVQAAASYLTAALIEMQSFAVNEAGQAMPNPYGSSLRKRGYEILKGITGGSMYVAAIHSRADVGVRAMARSSNSAHVEEFIPVTGFPSGSSL